MLRIASVAITEADFSLEFSKAIEQQVWTEQDAHEAGNETLHRNTQAGAAAATTANEMETAPRHLRTSSGGKPCR